MTVQDGILDRGLQGVPVGMNPHSATARVRTRLSLGERTMAWKHVTKDDELEYSKFFRHHIDNIIRSKPPGPLYHYTAGSTLIQILQSGQMWATHVSCLNDSKEWVYAAEAFRDALIARRSTVSTEFRPCFDQLERSAQVITSVAVPAFVTCFSLRNDDLSQWRAYGGQAGYCLEFDFMKLAQATDAAKDVLVPVLYGNGANVLLNDAITWAETYFRKGVADCRAPSVQEWASDFSDFWLWSLGFYAPMIKHDSFRDEAEWRTIRFLRPEDTGNMMFLQRSAMMTRHLPKTLGEKPAPNLPPRLPITKVTVGPTNHADECRLAVGDLLVKCGYGQTVPVENSRIPYRPYL